MECYWQVINDMEIWSIQKIKQDFFRAMSILLYRCTTWTLIKHIGKKLDENYSRILRAVKNKICKKHPTKQKLNGNLPPISQTIQVKWTRQVEHYWKNKDKSISDVLLWTHTHRRASIDQTEKIGRDMKAQPGAMNDRYRWWERIWELRAVVAT